MASIVTYYSPTPRDKTRQLADFKWYASESRAHGGPPRCPFASVGLCPKFFHSLSVLADGEQVSELDAGIRAELDAKWREHRPPVAEDSPGWAKDGNNSIRQVWGMCPEVTNDVYGVFASYVAMYPDELDRDLAYRRMKREGASADDPRWRFATVIPEHYTECRHYSVLMGSASNRQTASTVVQVSGSPQTHVTLGGTDSSDSKLKNVR